MEILLAYNEIKILSDLVKTLNPRNILEIGSYQGGSLSIFRTAAPTAHIVSIEPRPEFDPTLWGVELFKEESTTTLAKLKGREFDFIFVDGNHATESVVFDLKGALPLLSDRGVIVCHDSNYPTVRAAINIMNLEFKQLTELTPYEEGKWGGLAQFQNHTENLVEKWGIQLAYRPGTFDLMILGEMDEQYQFVDYSQVRTVLDVGAHIGFFTNTVYAKNPEVHFICVEMAADNFEYLVKNTAQMPSVDLRFGAVHYDQDVKAIRWLDGNTGSGRLVKETPDGNVGDLTISTKFYTLEDLIKEPIDVLKLDCEGSEFDILLNVETSTMKKVHYMVGEYHSTAQQAQELFKTFLKRHKKWSVEFISDTDGLGFFYLVNTAWSA